MISNTNLEIKNAILQKLKEIDLSLDNFRGQGYNGGANIAGKYEVQSLM